MYVIFIFEKNQFQFRKFTVLGSLLDLQYKLAKYVYLELKMNKIDMYENCKVIAFDADDTLWVNETYFRDAEKKFAKILSKYETQNKIEQELLKQKLKIQQFMVMV